MNISTFGRTSLALLMTTLMFSGCGSKPSKKLDFTGNNPYQSNKDVTGGADGAGGPGAASVPNPSDGTALTCGGGASYAGLGGEKLEGGRNAIAPEGSDRFRLKSTELLEASYQSTFGALPKSFATYRQTFGVAKPRWVTAPIPSAFTNFALFVLGREAAQTVITADPSWAARLTEPQIKEGCALFAQRVWKRPAPEESVNACLAYMQDPKMAALPPADRWSYGLASILSSIDYIAY